MQVSDDNFNTTVIDIKTTDTNYAPFFDLSEGTNWWRVITHKIGTASWYASGIAEFIIDRSGPSKVVLISPVDNSYVTNSYPAFDWQEASDDYWYIGSGVNYYTLQISSNQNFSNIRCQANATGLDYTIGSALESRMWYFRVRAVDNLNNIGEWSVTNGFTVVAPEIIIKKTAQPSAVAPDDILTYKIIIKNIGQGTAHEVKIADAIPEGTKYVADSLKTTDDTNTTYAGATARSDTENDDVACISGNQVIFCLKSGQAPDTGGILAVGESVAAFFQVRIFTNYAGVTFTNLLSLTNKDDNFDGYILEHGDVIKDDSLCVGDMVITNITGGPTKHVSSLYQYANDRDHYIEDDIFTCSDSDYITVGQVNLGVGADDKRNIQSFLTFGLGNINSSATITSATLFLKMRSKVGTPELPFKFDHIVYSDVYDTSTDLQNRYLMGGGRSFIETNFYSLNNLPEVNDWVKVPCTSQVDYAFNDLKTYTEIDGSYRIFQVKIRDNDIVLNNPLSTDWVDFYSQNNLTLWNRPYLKVYYTLPAVYVTNYINKQVRAFTGFNLISIPDGWNITSTTLHLHCYQFDGTESDIQPIYIDHIDYYPSLDSSDYDGCSIYTNGFRWFNPTTESGWMRFDIKDEIEYARNKPKGWTKDSSDTWFQIRLRPNTISSIITWTGS